MGGNLSDAITVGLIARKLKKELVECNNIQREQLGVLREIRKLLVEK